VQQFVEALQKPQIFRRAESLMPLLAMKWARSQYHQQIVFTGMHVTAWVISQPTAADNCLSYQSVPDLHTGVRLVQRLKCVG